MESYHIMTSSYLFRIFNVRYNFTQVQSALSNRNNVWVLHTDWLRYSRWGLTRASEKSFLLADHPEVVPTSLPPVPIDNFCNQTRKRGKVWATRDIESDGANDQDSEEDDVMFEGPRTKIRRTNNHESIEIPDTGSDSSSDNQDWLLNGMEQHHSEDEEELNQEHDYE